MQMGIPMTKATNRSCLGIFPTIRFIANGFRYRHHPQEHDRGKEVGQSMILEPVIRAMRTIALTILLVLFMGFTGLIVTAFWLVWLCFVGIGILAFMLFAKLNRIEKLF